MNFMLLYLFGAIGAAFYAFPTFLASRSAEDTHYIALSTLLFSVFVGGIFGGVVTPFLGHRWPWTIDPVPYPLALGVGLLANPLLPLIIERGKALFDSFRIGGPKQ